MLFEVSFFPSKFHPKLCLHFEEIQVFFDQSYDGISMFQIPKNLDTDVITSHSFIHLQPIIIIYIIILLITSSHTTTNHATSNQPVAI